MIIWGFRFKWILLRNTFGLDPRYARMTALPHSTVPLAFTSVRERILRHPQAKLGDPVRAASEGHNKLAAQPFLE